MQTILRLLNIPAIKIIGIGVVLYFGLFSNKENPDSLANRLSKERIEQNIAEIKNQSNFILQNVSMVKKDPAAQELSDVFEAGQDFSSITITDEVEGSGEEIIKCGDNVEISYDIYVKNALEPLESHAKEQLMVGGNKNALLEKKIIGMKKGGVRLINIPSQFKSTNKKLLFLLQFNAADLVYKVTLLNFNAASNQNQNCLN